MKAGGMRLFDVAINGKTVINDLDTWKEAGTNSALKKTVKARIAGGKMIISFPESKAGEALISAIAIASLKKTIKPASSQSLIINHNESYKVLSWLDIGDKQYKNETITIRSLPSNLFGADWLQHSKDGEHPGPDFTVTEDADVFVGTLLTWSEKDYEKTNTVIETDEGDGKQYIVYRKRFSKGTRINLPSDQNYFVIVMPVTHMQPAYDLKPVTAYRANVAVVSEGMQKEMFATRECAVVKSSSAVSIEWPVQTGVADIYSITVKYYWPQEKEIKGRIQLLDAGNSMMMDLPVNFTFTRSGKWNQFTVNTVNMINAGNYRIRLVIENAEGLAISGIDIQ